MGNTKNRSRLKKRSKLFTGKRLKTSSNTKSRQTETLKSKKIKMKRKLEAAGNTDKDILDDNYNMIVNLEMFLTIQN